MSDQNVRHFRAENAKSAAWANPTNHQTEQADRKEIPINRSQADGLRRKEGGSRQEGEGARSKDEGGGRREEEGERSRRKEEGGVRGASRPERDSN